MAGFNEFKEMVLQSEIHSWNLEQAMLRRGVLKKREWNEFTSTREVRHLDAFLRMVIFSQSRESKMKLNIF